MSGGNSLEAFGKTAQGLARNPLGIIALFIVLVYGFASLVAAFSSSFSPAERAPLIYFLVVFPVLVLGVFAWLVRWHSEKLFGPGDFKDETNYIKMQMSAVASLSAATVKENPTNSSQSDIDKLVELVLEAMRGQEARDHVDHILWVDDRPDNNIHERRALEAVGLRFTLALSTEEAMRKIDKERFIAIISDMGRREGPREGYVLLDELRAQGNNTPLFFYASSNAPEHKLETANHGGQGCTNNPQELFQMVTRAVITNRSS
ncbi:response regulator [Shimia sp. R9_3]|uniref:response regulator n=1 Tax=Shimia sp. R9_3 TaxID=2821113 RepID=UPI001ADC4707|nr:response regulator [Shimia sp. R9_3]MBO9400531.1 response regulator [Shimia sp. R9_3]